jgi:predicted metalloprotease
MRSLASTTPPRAGVRYRVEPNRSPMSTMIGIVVVGLVTLLSWAAVPYASVRALQPGSVATAPAPTTPPDHETVAREPRARPMETTAPPTEPPTASETVGAPLYGLQLQGSCSRPGLATSWATVEVAIRAQAECLDRMWQPVVEAAGARWTSPVLLFYSDPINSTPCGATPDKATAPAHYCPGNRTIYVSDAIVEPVAAYRLLGFEVIAHEYMHHVQRLVGILQGAYDSGRDDVATRRVELQAHCVAYAAMMSMDGLGVSTRELDQLRRSWRSSSDPEGHGSAQALAYWGERGIKATQLGACDTFSVAEDLVT